MKVAVIGAGIIGITNAISLIEEGFEVTIFTKDEPLNTNSDAAIATWYAPDNSKPVLQKSCIDSLEEFKKLADIDGSGVRFIPIIYYFSSVDEMEKSALKKKECADLISNEEYNKPVTPIGFKYDLIAKVPLADVNIYRPYLLTTFKDKGGEVKIQKIESFNQLAKQGFRYIINCSGWESTSLASDPDVYPIRGQVEIAKMNNPKLNDNRLSINMGNINRYIIFRPESNDVVIGATHQENDADLTVRDEDKQILVEKLRSLCPDITQDTHSKVGIRCGRKDLRLEKEFILNDNDEQVLIVHCYGHGGSGFSGSWGSAAVVVKNCESFRAEIERNFTFSRN